MNFRLINPAIHAAIVLFLVGFADASAGNEAVENPAARAVAELKKQYSPAQMRADDRLLAKYAEAHATAHGLDPDWQRQRLDRTLAQQPELDEKLDPAQIGAWRELTTRGWDGRVDWDLRRLTPGEITPGISFRGSTGADARRDFDARLGALVKALFGFSAADTLYELAASDAEIAGPLEGEAPVIVHRASFGRMHNGMPVFDDRYNVTLLRNEHDDGTWRARVSARWARSINDRAAVVTADDAAAVVLQADPDANLLESPRLGFRSAGEVAQPAYEVWMRVDRTRLRYFVSALNGEILERQVQSVENHDGKLRAYVRRPYEHTSTVRPLPFANIYEDALAQATAKACYFTPGFDPQVRGDGGKLNDTTDKSGDYENAAHFDAGDTSWVVDFRGPNAIDLSPYPDHTIGGIPAGADFTIPQSTDNARNRRGEAFYLLNYGHRIYNWYQLPQYAPLGFSFDALGAEAAPEGACLDPNVQIGCCGGGTEAGCIWMECDMGTTGTPAAERRFREVLMHEQAHNLAYKANGGFLCSGCGGDPTTDGRECACWEEGRADFGAIAINRFEKHRADFSPGLLYPNDFVGAGGLYGPGGIFTAVYIDYMLRAGLDAIGDVQRNLDEIDQDTRMVGLCASAVDWTTCPVNSFYRHLLASQAQWAFPRWRNSQEISAAFHAHVTDADRGTPGVQEFPWADEIPNRLFNAPAMYTDFAGVDVVTAVNGNEGGGLIALNSADDFDTVMFMARDGETYTVGTTALAPGVDTMLEVLTIDANQAHFVAVNDDCNGGPESCVTFEATETGFHRITVTSHPGAVTGPNATYRIYVDLSDDVGDAMGEADTLSPDDVMHDAHGVFETVGDVDVYAVTVPTAQKLGFVGCSTDESFKVKVEVRNSADEFVSLRNNRKCNKPTKKVSVDAGTYYLHVSNKAGNTGSYGLRISLEGSDIDGDDTPANAHPVTADLGIGTLFENPGDEDWFIIDGHAGRTYVVETIGIDAGVDTRLEVYAPTETMYAPPQLEDTSGHDLGHWMVRDNDGGLRSQDARTVFWAPVSGDYLLRVRPAAGSSTGRYHLLLHDNSGYTNDYPEFP